MQHYYWIKKLEAQAGLELPTGRRRVPHGPTAIEFSRGFTVGECEKFTDEIICNCLDDAIDDVLTHLMIACDSNDLDETKLPNRDEIRNVAWIEQNYHATDNELSLTNFFDGNRVIITADLPAQNQDEGDVDIESDVEDDVFYYTSSGDESEDGMLYEVEAILDDRLDNKKRFYLIKWRGYGSDQNSWEPERYIVDPSLISEYNRDGGGAGGGREVIG